ncbi:MAG: multifunctional CCA addition/repair protein [Gammaproteobacteria bacterium]|nr:multifunctional CCA addition/repair protein [Gammaproteobacteria bacterium]
MDIYLVGGAVRDKLLGLPVSERDWVVVGATVQEMVDLGYQAVGKDFPVFLHPQTKEEYALARTERKTAPGYTGFDICADPAITLEEDLLRRDLTINAMAETAHGKLIDPYGGQDDLDNGLLRHVSPAFSEDPVRVLRVARFAARFAHYGFNVAHDTNALMRRMVDNGEVDYLVAERVWAELHKALASNTPARFFTVLAGCGALKKLFPEVAELPASKTAAHEQAHLALPVLNHAVDMSDSRTIRLAALVCDLDNGTDGGLDRNQLNAFCERLRLPNSYRELADMALQYRQRLHDSAQLSASELLDLLTALDAFRRAERLADFIAVCATEAHSMNPAMQDYAPADLLERALLAAESITPDTAGKSGKEIGKAIRDQRIKAIENILL